MRILLTGARGFLGWHTRTRLHALGGHEIVAVDRDEWPDLATFATGVDAVIHLAGVNRGSDHDVEQGNPQLAQTLVDALRTSGATPQTVIYANSVHAGAATPYGRGKQSAADLLARAAVREGWGFVDVRLPNLFGEHGRPRYNSFVATFAHAVVNGETPPIADRPVALLHVQRAAQTLIDGLASSPTRPAPTRLAPEGTGTTVLGVYQTLRAFREVYTTGDLPALLTDLEIDLFNTLRAALFPAHYPIRPAQRTDGRGSLVEIIRSQGGPGQMFFSTTRPGVTRGEHFHLRKVERFVVLDGTARISLRRLFDDEIVSFAVAGDRPAIVDIPTLWTHNITNTGNRALTTLFWSNELFDPARPDTFPEPVVATGSLQTAGV